MIVGFFVIVYYVIFLGRFQFRMIVTLNSDPRDEESTFQKLLLLSATKKRRGGKSPWNKGFWFLVRHLNGLFFFLFLRIKWFFIWGVRWQMFPKGRDFFMQGMSSAISGTELEGYLRGRYTPLKFDIDTPNHHIFSRSYQYPFQSTICSIYVNFQAGYPKHWFLKQVDSILHDYSNFGDHPEQVSWKGSWEQSNHPQNLWVYDGNHETLLKKNIRNRFGVEQNMIEQVHPDEWIPPNFLGTFFLFESFGGLRNLLQLRSNRWWMDFWSNGLDQPM